MIGQPMQQAASRVCRQFARKAARSTNGSVASLVSTRQCRSLYSTTSILLEKITVNVPTMGDSITEGTIVEWTADIGQAVKEGDVVALVETDKVTVDIKAEVDGVIVQQFGAVDDNIEVGAQLYEIDTEAGGTIAAASTKEKEPTAAAETTTPEPETTAPESTVSIPSHTRSPLIHFLGKSGWAKRLAGIEESPAAPASPSSPTAVVTMQGEIHPMYGRPRFTEKEMEALIMGGAETAPSVVSHSDGARFAV